LLCHFLVARAQAAEGAHSNHVANRLAERRRHLDRSVESLKVAMPTQLLNEFVDFLDSVPKSPT
jgi:hypothetical protein